MKYKVGVSKNKDISIVVETKSDIFRCKSYTINDINGNNKKVRMVIPRIFLGYEVFNDLPSLLKKPFSLSKLSLFAFLTAYGTPSSVNHNIVVDMVEGDSEIETPIAQPKLIPNQSIIFQKLSRFKRALMKFFITPLVVAYQCILTTFTDLILARFKKVIKVITTILLIITTMGWTGSTCSANELLPLITQAEDRYLIPRGLLLAIAKIESGNRPYALNIAGKAVIATSKQEAVAVVRHHLDQGRSNIDLGVMQLNFYWHGSHFKNIEEMLTPSSNINYGAKFLSELFKQHGTWQKAVRYYHSSSPEHYKQYSRKVLISWLGI